MPSFSGMKDSFLGSAKSGRGQVNTMVILVAFVLSIMTINTHNKCNAALKDKTTPKLFTDDSAVKLMYYVSILILVMCILLFGYDLAIMFALI